MMSNNSKCNQPALSRQALLHKIMETDFAIYDLVLYLDTHPDDCECLEMFMKLKESCKQLKDEYAKKFGPLTFSQVNSENYWTWISDAWPWEGGCE